jgi:5'-deoxynucleotidase YfbR-like HD superfamily hydrolase
MHEAYTELNIHNMIRGQSSRLRYVIRYSTCQRLHSENVAEHSYYVALYSMLIADWAIITNREAGSKVDHAEVVRYALLHDLEEAITGDIPRSFKYSLPEMAEIYHSGAEMAMTQICHELYPQGHSSYTMCEEYINDWRQAKDEETMEGCIVRFADYLAVLSYMVNELTNNKTMQDNWKTMHDYARTFDKTCYNFLRKLINQADEILAEAFKEMTHHGS